MKEAQVSIYQYLELGAVLLTPVATYPLCKGIINGSQRPSKMTWIIWTLLTVILAGGMYQADKLSSQMIIILACDFVIVGLLMWFGKSGWTKTDKLTLLACTVIMASWAMTGNALVAIVLSLLANAVATWPMLKELKKNPLAESPLPYSIMFAASWMQLFSIETWQWASALQPAVYISIQAVILILLLRGRMKNIVLVF